MLSFSIAPLLPKALYFCFYLMYGFSAPFYSLILSGRVGDDRIVGFTMGAMFLVQLLACPIWGIVADVSGRPRLVLCALLLVSLSARCCVLFLPASVPLFVVPLVFVGSEVFFCGSIPVMDGFVCQLIGTHPFGHQRLFGAISWGIAAPLAGFLFSQFSWSLEISLALTLCGSLSIVALLFFAAPSPQTASSGKSLVRVSFVAAIRETKLTWQQVCFFAILPFAGLSSSSIGTFLFLFLKNGESTVCYYALSKLRTLRKRDEHSDGLCSSYDDPF